MVNHLLHTDPANVADPVGSPFGGKRHEMVGTGNRLSKKQIGFLIYA